jgi:hypothetical protein
MVDRSYGADATEYHNTTFKEMFDRPHPGQVALAFASIGFRIVPIKPGTRKPTMKRWPERATNDRDTILDWWGDLNRPVERRSDEYGDFAGYLAGVATGWESGFWVLDIDIKTCNGFRTLRDRYGVVQRPDTFIVRTQTGGEHWYFRYPDDGREIKTGNWPASLKVGPGIDSRGKGGQVLLPFQGVPGPLAWKLDRNRVYGYEARRDALTLPLLSAPRWLEDLCEKKPYEPDDTVPTITTTDAALGALETEAARLAVTTTGGRNGALNMAAFRLGLLAGLLSEADARAALFGACRANGLLDDDGEGQCELTFSGAWRAGSSIEEKSA